MKNICIILLFVFSYNKAFSQSAELTTAYKQVCTTLKEYKFEAEDAKDGPEGRTKNISFTCQNGVLVFTFNVNQGSFSDPFFGHKHGLITIKVPLVNAQFQTYYGKLNITAKENNGVELTYKKQKEIIDYYSIYGTDGSLEKLHKELEEFLSIATAENFSGSLGVASNNKTTKNQNQTQNKAQKTNKSKQNIGKYVQ